MRCVIFQLTKKSINKMKKMSFLQHCLLPSAQNHPSRCSFQLSPGSFVTRGPCSAEQRKEPGAWGSRAGLRGAGALSLSSPCRVRVAAGRSDGAWGCAELTRVFQQPQLCLTFASSARSAKPPGGIKAHLGQGSPSCQDLLAWEKEKDEK